MTHDILQSDIELATRLRDDRRPDEEIIQALVHRGVDRAKAAQLLDDLRSGRKVYGQGLVPSEFTLRRRSRGEHPRAEAAASAAPQHRSSHPPRGGPRGEKGSKVLRWIFLVPVAAVVVIIGLVLLERHYAAAPAAAEPAAAKAGSNAPKRQVGAAWAGGSNAVAAPALELQADGLRIGGSLVTRANPLGAVVGVLGVPSRTNREAGSGATIYAYDKLGLLVYVQPAGRTNSIMLDCDATGGTNGTTLPFAGTIKIGDEIIGPETDAQALARLKLLGLRSVRSDGSIWGGHYGGLELVFAYLKTPRRLSLIEIELK